jgi:endonuclease/exonuclease/phosphatase family metal-dependent hydrolase
MKRLPLGLIAILLCASCTGDDPDPVDPSETTDPADPSGTTDPSDPSEVTPPTKTLAVATYNMGLAPGYVPYAAERRDPVVAAVTTSTADVICLQEVWFDEDREYVLSQLADSYPHQYSQFEEVESGGDPACTPEEGGPLMECATAAECDSATDLGNCVLTNCVTEYSALGPDCQQCLAANLGLGNMDDIFVACTSGSTEWLYEGRHGAVLLSKQPMTNTQLIPLNSWLIVRPALYAEVDGAQILCTHMSTELGVDYGGDFESYEAEHKDQLDTLIAAMDTNNLGGPQIISGDFNAGPAVGDLSGEWAENYSALDAAGYADANCNADVPFCTWCEANLISNDPVNSAIDHIMVRQASTSAPQRLYDGSITIESETDGTVEVSLSDHFGMQVDVTWEE